MAHQVLRLTQQKPQQCSAIKTVEFIYQVQYLLLVTFEIDDNYSIPFKISNDSSTIRFDLKRKNTIRTALVLYSL